MISVTKTIVIPAKTIELTMAQWKKREYADHEPTGQIMCDMVGDVDRIKAHKIEKRFQFRVSEDWGCFVPPRGGILFSGVSS